MHLLGLIGYPLEHSFSKRYFTDKFAREGIHHVCYELFPLSDLSALPELLLQHPELRGFNVTIPYKQAIVPLIHTLDPVAELTGAVNTVVVEPTGRLSGYNTDAEGFLGALQAWFEAEGQPTSSRLRGEALVLGTGGSAQAVGYALQKLGIAHLFVSRRPSHPNHLPWEALDDPVLWQKTWLIINTTPLGMYPNTNACPPLPFSFLTDQHWVFDLVYNPAETLLLQQAKRQGAHTTNGLNMLHRQAEVAWAIWQNTLS